jgi:hypothetical protein
VLKALTISFTGAVNEPRIKMLSMRNSFLMVFIGLQRLTAKNMPSLVPFNLALHTWKIKELSL